MKSIQFETKKITIDISVKYLYWTTNESKTFETIVSI